MCCFNNKQIQNDTEGSQSFKKSTELLCFFFNKNWNHWKKAPEKLLDVEHSLQRYGGRSVLNALVLHKSSQVLEKFQSSVGRGHGGEGNRGILTCMEVVVVTTFGVRIFPNIFWKNYWNLKKIFIVKKIFCILKNKLTSRPH